MKMPVCLTLLCALSVSLATMRGQQPASAVMFDASAPIAPPETGFLHMGGASPAGHRLEINSRFLIRDGKPWLPVMGEIHYTRVPEAEWEEEILKMKAAGIEIIATYVFWIHHEEVEGQFDWTGRRDLRRFVQLCAKHGMYVYVRPGPWAHGEVRNGGFPDWLMKVPNTRTNDPAYLAHVATFFAQIGLQLHGLMWKDGGPVIGAQLENEYGQHGAGRGAEHLLRLKQMAVAAGIDPPFFSVTGWPSLDFPTHEVIPVSGGYPDGFWFGSQKNLPPGTEYLFNFNRELGDMGATVPSNDPTGKVDLRHDPYFAAEEAGGMASSYHRRPVLTADDIAANTLTGLGSGLNLYGYYMFHGGANPPGKLSTLQESQRTGYPNDLPEISYDFEAPVGEAGQIRESYRKTRLMHLFLNAYGPELARMPAFAPARKPRNASDTATPRAAVRTDGRSGYLFVNNYVRQMAMPARPGFQVSVKLPGGVLQVPEQPVTMPADSYFIWPFNLEIGRARLLYSTAQVLTRLDTAGGQVTAFFAVPSIEPVFVFQEATVRAITASSGRVSREHGRWMVDRLRAGMDTTVLVTDREGTTSTLLLLTKDEAEHTAVLPVSGRDVLALSQSDIVADGDQVRLRSTLGPRQEVAFLPAVKVQGGVADDAANGLWKHYRIVGPEAVASLTVTDVRAAVPRQAMTMGPYVSWRKTSVPMVPEESAFETAGTWDLKIGRLPTRGLSNVYLDIDYTGDIGHLQRGDVLLDDNFYNGKTWEISLKGLGAGLGNAAMQLKILPMPAISPIYLEEGAREQLSRSETNPKLIRARLIPEYESVLKVELP